MSNPNTLTAAPEGEVDLQAERADAYGRYLSLEEQGLTPDGPNLNKIGLDYTERIRLGYDGSMDNFVEDAKAWKAEQDEAARIDAYRAENNAKADAWHKETQALRDTRKAANERVASLVDGTAAVAGLSYKEKLEAGGEFGIRKKIEQSKMSEADAIELAEAEGHDVSHRKPRTLEVVTNKGAEARAKEMAELLNAQLPRASRAVESPNGETTPGTAPATTAAETETPAGAESDDTTEAEPVTELDDASLRGRLKKIWDKGRDKLLKLYVTTENHIVSPKKHGELTEAQLRKRRLILNGAIGTAIMYKAWATYNGVHAGGGSSLATELANTTSVHGSSGHEQNPDLMAALTGNQSGHNSTNNPSQLVDALTGQSGGAHEGLAIPSTLSLSHGGDSIEGMLTSVAHQHGTHLSEGQIHALVSQTLEHNHLSWEDARSLPIGYQFDVPDAVRQQLAAS